jgi:hypothetical protein
MVQLQLADYQTIQHFLRQAENFADRFVSLSDDEYAKAELLGDLRRMRVQVRDFAVNQFGYEPKTRKERHR